MVLDTFKWRLSKMRSRVRRTICSTLYQEQNSDVRNSILVAGTGRSGTTWLARIIASQLRCRVMFEPFHPVNVDGYSNFNYFQYMPPDEDDDTLNAFCEWIFRGTIRNAWVDRQVEYLRPHHRLIKEIRANLFLRWIHERFPVVPILFIIRHPCAVVQSRLSLNWATDGDIRPFLAQDRLVEDFLSDKMEIIERATTPEEKHAIVWCVSNLVPLRQFHTGSLNVVFYEHLCERPEEEIPRIFRLIGQSAGSQVFREAARPSTTSTRNSSVVSGGNKVTQWQSQMTSAQRDRILGLVERFGLDYLYGDSSTPGIEGTKLSGS